MTEPHTGQNDGGSSKVQDAHRTPHTQSPQAMAGAANSTGADPASRTGAASEALVGPFTLRETVLAGSVLIMFIGTLLPFFDSINFWAFFPLFFLAIGILLPVAALGLIIARRLGSPKVRVGSLSADQFASVIASFAAAFFFLHTVTDFGLGQLIGLLGSLGFLAATVGGPLIPPFASDFSGRPASDAHRVARDVAPAKPRAPKPVAAEQVKQWNDPQREQSGGPTQHGAQGQGQGQGPYAPGGGQGTAGVPTHLGQPDQSQKSGTGAFTGAAAASGSGQQAHHPDASADRGRDGSVQRELSTNPEAPTPDAHLDSAVSAVPGVQDKELPSADTGESTYPRSADEDFAPQAEISREQAQEPAAEREQPAPETTVSPRVPTQSTEKASVDSGHVEPAQREAQETVNDAGAATHAPTMAQQVVTGPQAQEDESISATRDSEDEPMVEAFWFAVGTPRPVVDEQSGAEIFVLQPGDWEVGIEDRGNEFLVQDKRNGRIGVMRDLSNIERAPREG
ncbi:hypothetical protein [Arthrobacter sp. H5]|uniref:hypothetical protein n=1 Tax=Arthrobacter sp. H5 TaxID=1267973 RepID=UPI0004850685|nr:hypothetical protein [Arthrobacter sp. H5]